MIRGRQSGVENASIAYKRVMKAANHNSCALSSELESDRHSPRLMSYVLPKITKTQVAWESPPSVSTQSNPARGGGATYRNTQPPDEAMVSLEGVVVVTVDLLGSLLPSVGVASGEGH
jgi:hypothetical protein